LGGAWAFGKLIDFIELGTCGWPMSIARMELLRPLEILRSLPITGREQASAKVQEYTHPQHQSERHAEHGKLDHFPPPNHSAVTSWRCQMKQPSLATATGA
jgi:hypothetical protein